MRSLPGPLCPSVGQGRDSVASPPCPASEPPPRTQVSPGSLGEHRQVREVPSPRGCWPPAGFPGKCGQHWVTDYRHSPTPSTQAGLLGTPGRNRLRARGRSLRAPPEGVSRLLEGQPVSQFQSSESRGTERRGEMTAACAGAQGLMSGAQHPGARGPGPSAGRSGSWLEKGGGSKTGGQRLAWPFPCAGVPLKAPVEPAGTCSPRRATVESPEAPGAGGEPTAPPALGRPCFPQVGSPAQPTAATGPPKGHRQSRVRPQLQPAGSLSPFPPGVWALDKNSLLINEGDTGEGTGSADTQGLRTCLGRLNYDERLLEQH